MTATGRRSWKAALAPPTAWLVHVAALYGAEEIVCSSACMRNAEVLGLTLLGAMTVVVTVAALGVAVAGGLLGYQLWSGSRDADLAARPPAGRDAFMGLAGVLLGAMFAGVILLETSPAALLAPCTV